MLLGVATNAQTRSVSGFPRVGGGGGGLVGIVERGPRPSPRLIHSHAAAAQASRSCSRDWRQTRRGGDTAAHRSPCSSAAAAGWLAGGGRQAKPGADQSRGTERGS